MVKLLQVAQVLAVLLGGTILYIGTQEINTGTIIIGLSVLLSYFTFNLAEYMITH